MTDLPSGYYDRFDPSKNYERHLFRAGFVLQSAELNEVQRASQFRTQSLGDALFRDGDIVRDARIVVDAETGETTCESGAIYLSGTVRGVPTGSFTIPIDRSVSVGIWLTETVVSELQDPDLRDPAAETRNYNEPGASRLKILPSWGYDEDGTPNAQFFPIYLVDAGVLRDKEPPPTLDSVTQAIARYDRDSSGSNYVVNGMRVTQLPDVGGNQVYNVQEGRARVNGFAVNLSASRRVLLAAVPDLRFIDSEPRVSTSSGSQRINVDRTPISSISQVRITAQKTVSINHGTFAGAQDPLPDTSVVSIVSVSQGPTTYVATTDYLLTAGKVDWSPAGNEPAPGSTYSVTYQYITSVTPTGIDETGFTITGAVSGTLVLTNYYVKLPRIDRLCLNEDGETLWITGVSTDYDPVRPPVPSNLLSIAQVLQTWTSTRLLVNDGVRVVPMSEIEQMNLRMDRLTDLIAQQNLVSDLNTRSSAAKKGVFVDPFLDDSQRDAGISQTAAIVDGVLTLPVSGSALSPASDITTPQSCSFTLQTILKQELRTSSMKINPFLAFSIPPAQVSLTPAIDRWTQVISQWASPITRAFVLGSGGVNGTLTTTSSVRQTLVVRTTAQLISTLRSIDVRFRLAGFGPGEVLSSVTFDGISVTPVAP